jgi:hypothetical protein
LTREPKQQSLDQPPARRRYPPASLAGFYSIVIGDAGKRRPRAADVID